MSSRPLLGVFESTAVNIQTSFSGRLVYSLFEPLISELTFLVNVFPFSLLPVVLCASHLTTATFKVIIRSCDLKCIPKEYREGFSFLCRLVKNSPGGDSVSRLS